MKEMTALDASILALIADTVHSHGTPQGKSEVLRRLKELAKRVEDGELRQVADALISGANNIDGYPEDVRNTVKLLRNWAERNRRVHSPPEEKATT